ncbi:hypothetical protein [Rhodovarius lipocyclicus]|uniref:hypothetical protein n=1 Tax=Rhodovarius lipocyclicus TaxID=268410 RepID=UPI00135CA7A5|nr:hypothetical protein [Rhodovarius lipocyclicus]
MDIKELLRDKRAMTDGVWVNPMPGREVEVLARAFTPQYRERLDGLFQEWRRLYGSERLAPANVTMPALADLVVEELIGGIRGLKDGDTEVSLDQVKAFAGMPEGAPIYQMLLSAVERADARRESDAKAAAGN